MSCMGFPWCCCCGSSSSSSSDDGSQHGGGHGGGGHPGGGRGGGGYGGGPGQGGGSGPGNGNGGPGTGNGGPGTGNGGPGTGNGGPGTGNGGPGTGNGGPGTGNGGPGTGTSGGSNGTGIGVPVGAQPGNTGRPDTIDTVCVPMNVDAFILNKSVCDTGLTRIAPITQPDYRGLRTNNVEIRADILPPVDMHRTQPASVNSRISLVESANLIQVDPSQPASDTDGVPPLRTNRIGAYLHWSLPRMYRAATSSSDNVKNKLSTGENQSPSPTFRLVPNRWLVIRKMISSEPVMPTARGDLNAWIIESDRMWNVSDLGPDIDLETDVSPFVSYVGGDYSNPNVLNKQATVFIGAKYPLASWTEQGTSVPRVPLTTMNSSNFCFADNTIHNPNVFSMVDTFDYTNADGINQQLLQANCNYTVIGWHDAANADPLGPYGVLGALKDRLKVLFCNLTYDQTQPPPPILDSTAPMRVICYGSILNVHYLQNGKPDTPSEGFASLFTDAVPMEPVSVGTTPLDSVLTFLQAHSVNEDPVLGTGSTAVAKDVLALSQLLYDTEGTYDSRVKAADLIFSHNFLASNGGNAWHYAAKADPGGAPAQPSTIPDGTGSSPMDYLNKLNDLQLQLDASNRKLALTQWSMFSVWWKYVSDPNNTDPAQISTYSTEVSSLRSTASGLSNQINSLANQILAIRKIKNFPGGPVFLPKVQSRIIAQPHFYQRKDPTICIAGMDSGWPMQYIGFVPVQFGRLLEPSPAPTGTPTELTALAPILATNSAIPAQIVTAIKAIIDYAVLSTTNNSSDIGFKVWSGQPWCPLYIEWEATYFHVPFDKWSVQILNSPVNQNHTQVRYGINETLYNDPQSASDQRTVSGRTILTPQPTVNLQALVAQVLGTAGVAKPTDMTVPQLLSAISQLKMISTELTGLTDSLITIGDGTHVQPNLHVPGETSITPLAAAVAAGAGIEMTQADFTLIGEQSASTPFGSIVDFSNSSNDPFKPVTHGQFRFTKLNIIDKFGQVISGIQPVPQQRVPTGLPDSMHPCLGDQICPGLIPGITPPQLNTVTALTAADPQLPGGYPLCPYVQLTPAINQPARINAEFVAPVTNIQGDFTAWKATNDWDIPVWAWVVVNYADYGLQFFTSNGTFFVELNLGGPTGSIQSTKWLPFDPPPATNPLISPQLLQLIAQMTGPSGEVYLRSFWDMITQSIENMPYAPADYATTASCIVGKPLALTNVGISLELSTPPLQSQTTLPPTNPAPALDLLSYEFPVKIGDKDRPFDGVLGYFDTDNTTTGSTEWSKLYTYFPTLAPTPQTGDPRVVIEPTTFPALSPFFADPDGTLVNNSYAATLAKQFTVKTVLLDPYTAIHVYSGILPITSLQLPAWVVQQALQTMSAFFHLGPLLIAGDVPTTYSATPLKASTWVSDQQALTPSEATAPIRLPVITGKKELWNWLQPYLVPTNGVLEVQYNGLQVGVDDGRIRLDPGPYTLVEGFLQLAVPLDSTA